VVRKEGGDGGEGEGERKKELNRAKRAIHIYRERIEETHKGKQR